jgi:hypothetical protein
MSSHSWSSSVTLGSLLGHAPHSPGLPAFPTTTTLPLGASKDGRWAQAGPDTPVAHSPTLPTGPLPGPEVTMV